MSLAGRRLSPAQGSYQRLDAFLDVIAKLIGPRPVADPSGPRALRRSFVPRFSECPPPKARTPLENLIHPSYDARECSGVIGVGQQDRLRSSETAGCEVAKRERRSKCPVAAAPSA